MHSTRLCLLREEGRGRSLPGRDRLPSRWEARREKDTSRVFETTGATARPFLDGATDAA